MIPVPVIKCYYLSSFLLKKPLKVEFIKSPDINSSYYYFISFIIFEIYQSTTFQIIEILYQMVKNHSIQKTCLKLIIVDNSITIFIAKLHDFLHTFSVENVQTVARKELGKLLFFHKPIIVFIDHLKKLFYTNFCEELVSIHAGSEKLAIVYLAVFISVDCLHYAC